MKPTTLKDVKKAIDLRLTKKFGYTSHVLMSEILFTLVHKAAKIFRFMTQKHVH